MSIPSVPLFAFNVLLLLGIGVAAFSAHLALGLAYVAWVAWIFTVSFDRTPPAPTAAYSNPRVAPPPSAYIVRDLAVPRDMEDEGAPAVHRCWNCDKPISLTAKRCKYCGVAQ